MNYFFGHHEYKSDRVQPREYCLYFEEARNDENIRVTVSEYIISRVEQNTFFQNEEREQMHNELQLALILAIIFVY